jgi:cell wall-associated NlpC family hydrolase
MRAIGPPLTAEESAAFLAALRSCIGVRFRHQRCNPTIGLDCRGLILWAFRKIGRTPKDVRGYGREPHKHGMEAALVENLGPPIPLSEMRAVDVVLMRFDGEPRHMGVLTNHPDGGFGLIHTHDEMKYVAEHVIDARREGFIVKAWRP